MDETIDSTQNQFERQAQNSNPDTSSVSASVADPPKAVLSPPRPGTSPVVSTPPPARHSPDMSVGDKRANDALFENINDPISTRGQQSSTEGETTDSEWPKLSTTSMRQAPSSPSSVASGGSYASEGPNSRMLGPTSPAGAGVGSPASNPGAAAVSQQSSHSAYLRTLTSTAAERKRTVAACRALRAQIIRFEEAFVQLHSRPPKGNVDRAPLATTYAQYREWKRAIRADAACRIQALVRGARLRMLMRSTGNPDAVRIVTNKSGRPGYVPDNTDGLAGPPTMERFSMPAGMNTEGLDEAMNQKRSQPMFGSGTLETETQQPPRTRLSRSTGSPHGQPDDIENGVEVVIGTNSAGAQATPGGGWTATTTSSLPPIRRSPSPVNSDGQSTRSASPPMMPDVYVGGMSTLTNIENMSMTELTARKRELKQQLKQYDMNFAEQHGRMPVKAEKEPIRRLYENYNALKGRISQLEQQLSGNRQSPQQSQPHDMQASSPNHRRSPSPTMTVSDGSSADESSPASTPPSARSRRGNRVPASTNSDTPDVPGMSSSPPLHGGSGSPGSRGSAGVSSIPSPASTNSSPQETLESLRAEKGSLHQMLRGYEKDFFRMHNRQVASFADIRPVANQYRRYKEIKRAIASIQQQQQGNER